jgi:hypothetical protein
MQIREIVGVLFKRQPRPGYATPELSFSHRQFPIVVFF